MTVENEINFLNVDVEIFASFDLSEMLMKLGPDVMKMYCDKYDEKKYLLALELSDCEIHNSPEEIISKFCDLFETKVKNELDQINKITFDIGYESGTKPNSIRHAISSETVMRVAKLKAEIIVSIYPFNTEQN